MLKPDKRVPFDHTNDEILANVPDWPREWPFRGWNPSKKLLRSIRQYQVWKARGGWLGRLMQVWYVTRWRKWSAITGADIPVNANLGGGFMMPHPNGVVIHPGAEIGVNCMVFQQVTVGSGPKPGLPTIGGHVVIAAGARVLGGITIGNHVTIGANAVVLQDVPAYATAVGIPARIILKPKSPGGSQPSIDESTSQPKHDETEPTRVKAS